MRILVHLFINLFTYLYLCLYVSIHLSIYFSTSRVSLPRNELRTPLMLSDSPKDSGVSRWPYFQVLKVVEEEEEKEREDRDWRVEGGRAREWCAGGGGSRGRERGGRIKVKGQTWIEELDEERRRIRKRRRKKERKTVMEVRVR